MSIQVPFFAPTSDGVLASIAHLPAREVPGRPAVAMLPSVKGERIRIDAYRDAARDLADRGHPVLRFDFPGYGADPGPPVDRSKAEQLMGEVTEWFRLQAGSPTLLVTGGCAGGLDAIRLAAANPYISKVVVQGERLRVSDRRHRPVVSVGLAAVDPLPERLRPRPDAADRPIDAQRWKRPILDALNRATRTAEVVFVHGVGSPEAADLAQLRLSGELDDRVLGRVRSCNVGSGMLNTTRQLADVEALRAALVTELAGSATDGVVTDERRT